jgi:hypothetical protein
VVPLEAMDELFGVLGWQATIPNVAKTANGIRIFFCMLMLLSEIAPRDITKQQRRKLSIIIFFDFLAFLPRKRFFRRLFYLLERQARLTTKPQNNPKSKKAKTKKMKLGQCSIRANKIWG